MSRNKKDDDVGCALAFFAILGYIGALISHPLLIIGVSVVSVGASVANSYYNKSDIKDGLRPVIGVIGIFSFIYLFVAGGGSLDLSEQRRSAPTNHSSSRSTSSTSISHSIRLSPSSTLATWRQASHSEQLELCMDMIRSIRGSLRIDIRDNARLRAYARELQTSLNIVARENPRERIMDIAVASMTLMGWYR